MTARQMQKDLRRLEYRRNAMDEDSFPLINFGLPHKPRKVGLTAQDKFNIHRQWRRAPAVAREGSNEKYTEALDKNRFREQVTTKPRRMDTSPVVTNSLHPADIIKTTLYSFKTRQEEIMDVPARVMQYSVDGSVPNKEKMVVHRLL